MVDTKNQKFIDLSKESQEYLSSQWIRIKPMVASESRQGKDPSEWELNPQIFQKICQVFGKPEKDFFVSRLSYQLLQYITWRQHQFSQGTDGIKQNCFPKVLYIFLPFCLINRVLHNVRLDKVEMILVVPTWHTQLKYPQLLQMLIAKHCYF